MSLRKDPFAMEVAAPFPTSEMLDASQPHARRFQSALAMNKSVKTRDIQRKQDDKRVNEK